MGTILKVDNIKIFTFIMQNSFYTQEHEKRTDKPVLKKHCKSLAALSFHPLFIQKSLNHCRTNCTVGIILGCQSPIFISGNYTRSDGPFHRL